MKMGEKRTRRDPIQNLLDSSEQRGSSVLEIFSVPTTKDSIVSTRDVTFRPLSSLDNEGEITFDISPSPDEFTNIAQTWLTLTVQVELSTGEKIPTIAELNANLQGDPDSLPEVSIPNDFMDCLFRQIGLEINSTRVGSDHYYHPHISVLENLLSHSEDLANRHLKHAICWQVRVRGCLIISRICVPTKVFSKIQLMLFFLILERCWRSF